jgi:hypothetical protein
MELDNRLALNRYFLNELGCASFVELKEKLEGAKEGFDDDGKSFFADRLIGLENVKISREDILRYDRAIREYSDRLRKNRRIEIKLKYFQYLAALFTEIFLDRYFNYRKQFLSSLNSFVDEFNRQETSSELRFAYFSEADLNKIAFWMATGSGKTLLMHINYWQFRKYVNHDLDNIILITPNEGLSRQHYNELRRSGIACSLYTEGNNNLTLLGDEVLVIDIHKLTEEKKGGGVRVEVDYFEGRNLVFIDEGHKGQATQERTWKNLREKLAETGFIFEYSATFGQVIGPRDKDLMEEYSKAIIFDYSYKFFYADGYGKDFYLYNLNEKSFQEKFRSLILTANLLAFAEQMLLYQNYGEELRRYFIEKPLWAFIGSKVSGAGINSDVLKVVEFLKEVSENRGVLRGNIKKILDGKSSLTDVHGNDIFSDRFEYIRQKAVGVGEIYEKLFNSTSGALRLCELKSADGEIGLRIGEGDYFGIINIGDVSGFKKLLAEKGIVVKSDNITPSLFEEINKEDSHVNMLIGAKKFIEGWDSWRVSSMSLINIGRGEGPQIIQLFGRGVRLKGRAFSLKRSEERKYELRAVETLNIFGLNADYMDTFLEALRKEEVEFEEFQLPIKLMDRRKWEQLFVLQEPEDFDFGKQLIRLELDDKILSKIKIDIRPRVRLAHGLDSAEAEASEEKAILDERFLSLLDWDDIYFEIIAHKTAQGYFNLTIDKGVLKEVAKADAYQLYAMADQVSPENFADLEKVREIVVLLLKSYVDRFYNSRFRQEESSNLQLAHLNRGDENFSFEKYVLKLPKTEAKEIEKLKGVLKQAEKLYENDQREIPTIHFDRHLYTPLVVYGQGKDFMKSAPPRLNKGETEFVRKLREYLKANRAKLDATEIYLLRNLSKKGVGFFQSSGFYPDFIMWVKEKGETRIAFIDPKGIRNTGTFNDEKVQLHRNIKDLERKLHAEKTKLESFIISVSGYSEIKDVFDGGGRSKEEFESNHVLFIEDSELVDKLLSNM